MAVAEGDDDAGPAADGSQVGVEGGQEEVVGLLDAGRWQPGLPKLAGEFDLGEVGGLPEGS